MDGEIFRPQWQDGWFNWPLRVYLEDVDAGGIVYHANHLKYAERARTEMLAFGGLRHADIMTTGAMIVVGRVAIEYLSPLRLEEQLLVKTRVQKMGNASATLEQVIENNGQPAARLEVGLVYLDKNSRPARWPESVRQCLSLPPEGEG